MTGRTSGEYSKDEPTLRWQMEYVIKTVESQSFGWGDGGKGEEYCGKGSAGCCRC
jgi:hypothetical protein